MRYFIETGGPVMWLLLIIALVILGLTIRNVVALFPRRAIDPAAREHSLHAILFWGGISALLGILGQLSGIYHAMQAIARADALSPSVMAQGFAESFTTTITGLTLLFFAAAIWFGLQARLRRLTRDGPGN